MFQYESDELYYPEVDGSISIVDGSLGIDWKKPTEKAPLSEKVIKHHLLKDFDRTFDVKALLH